MSDETPETPQSTSLLNELESLDIIEAEELQDGAAFHAFRFKTV